MKMKCLLFDIVFVFNIDGRMNPAIKFKDRDAQEKTKIDKTADISFQNANVANQC